MTPSTSLSGVSDTPTSKGGLKASEVRKLYQNYISGIDTKIGALTGKAGSEKELADLQYQKEKLTKKLEQIPADRPEPKGDPIHRGLVRLFASPEYRAGLPSQQRELRAQAYDRYIEPYYKKQGKTPPDKDYFVDRISPVKDQPLGEAIGVGAVAATTAATKMGRALWSGVYTVITKGTPFAAQSDPVGKKLNDLINKQETFLGEHYAEDTRARVIKGVGESVPGFIGWYLGAEVIGATGLTSVASKAWQRFAARRVADFALGFTMTKLDEKDNKESALVGGINAGLGSAFEFLGKLGTWLGPRAASKRILDDAHLLMERGSGPIITPPPSVEIPPTKELGGGFGTQRELPAARSIQQPASNLPPQKLLGTGLEGAQKPLDYISQANFRILNQATREVSGGRYKQFAMSPDSIRIQALKKVGYTLGNAIKDSASNNSEFVEHAAKANIEKQAAKSPQFKTIIERTSKVTGVSPSTSVAQHVKEMSEKEQVWAKVRELMKGLGPGAASKNEAAVLANVKDLVRSNLKLEGHKNQIAFAWSVREALPKDVKNVVAQEMKNLFGPNPKKWDSAANLLDKHIDKLIKSGHIKPVDMRGVFRSTNLTGQPTQWQEQLDRELSKLVDKMRESGKKFGPGAANIDDPAFKQPAPFTQAATDWHNEALRRAREELGPNASLSEVLQRAAVIQKAGK